MSTKIRCPECGGEMEIKPPPASQYILQCKKCGHTVSYLTESQREKNSVDLH